jgi:Sortase domain
MTSTSRHKLSFTTATVALLVLVLSACSAPAAESGGGRGVDSQPELPKATTEVQNAAISLAELNEPPAPAATRVLMPSLGIDMKVEPHGLDADTLMSLPVSPFRAGWYKFSPGPASDEGATVIAAHVDSLAEGVGPFAQLRRAEVGAAVSVVDAAGVRHEYRVISVERISKAEVPLDRVFRKDGAPVVVLVTCGGEFDRQADSYKDNYIVTAEKVS